MSAKAGGGLSPRERILGAAFAAVLLAIGAWFLWDALELRHAAAVRRQAELRAQISDAQGWLEKKALWEARAQWLAEGMKPALSANDASSQFLDQVQKSAAQQSLQISQQGLMDPEASAELLGVGAKLVFRGSLKDTARWLAERQQPGEFVELPLLELRPLPEAGQVECTAQLRRWFLQGKPAEASMAAGGMP